MPLILHFFRAAKLRLLNFLSLFRDLQKPTRFSGGVVAKFVRDLQEPTWFSGEGGGVVAGFFRDLQRNRIFTQH